MAELDPDSTATNFDTENNTTTALNFGNLPGESPPQVSPLEQEVLDEYDKLAGNMRELTQTLATLTQGPITIEIAEGLRLLERKVASVYTLMKASVYSIVLQQGDLEGEGGAEEGEGVGP